MTTAAPPFAALRANWRVTLAVFAALAVLLSAWYFFALRQNYVVLYRDLRPQEAAPIVAELDREHQPYRLAEGGAQILAPSASADALRVRLAGADLAPAGAAGFELFDQSDMGLTEFAQKIKYQRALQGELQRTISMLDGVVAARVHISTPEQSLFRSDQAPARAAVTLVTRTAAAESAAQIEGIQRLVAAAVTDLSPGDVVVLNERGEVLSSTVESLSAHAPASLVQPASLLGSVTAHDRDEDAFTLVIARALAGRRFALSIAAAEPTPAESGPADSDTAAPTPASATPPPAPRVIEIATETPLDTTTIEQLSAALRGAELLHPTDTLVFHTGLDPAQTPAAYVPLTQSPPGVLAAPVIDAARAQHRRASFPWEMPAGLLVVIVTAGLLWRRNVQAKRLRPGEHESFAARLAQSLAPDGRANS